MEAKKRIDWIDRAKGYGILCVIVGHLGIKGLTSWVYTFHIPLFFLLSGYLFSSRDGFAVFLKKKVRSLLIPYFCLGILTTLFSFVQNWLEGTMTAEYALYCVKGLLVQRRYTVMWFIACLFLLEIMYYTCRKGLRTDVGMTVLAAVLLAAGWLYDSLGGQPLPWNVDSCVMAFPFFHAGQMYRKHRDKADRLLERRRWVIPAAVCALVNVLATLVSYYISGERLDMHWSRYGFVPFSYLSAFAGIAFVIILSKRAVPWDRPIRYIGRNSLTYYVWHYPGMMYVSEWIIWLCGIRLNGAGMAAKIGYQCLQLLLILSLCTLLNEAFLRLGLGFVFGRPKE